MELSPTEVLARYVADAKFEDLPENIIELSKKIILDTLGCALAGSKTRPGQVVIDTVKDLGGNPESTIIGDGYKVNCVLAGFVNSITADVLDLEDYVMGQSHPSAVVIPSAFAVGERTHASGKDIINAVVLGYEVSIRIGYAILCSKERGKSIEVKSYAFGAAVPAAKLLGLDWERIEHAFGYAGASCPPPIQIMRWPRPLHWNKNNFGESCMAGILGAVLAQRGFIAPHGVLDWKDVGFWTMIGSDRCDFERFTQRIGDEYEIMRVAFKPYSSCRGTHHTLDTVYSVIRENKIKPEDIEQITIGTPSRSLVEYFMDYEPKTIVDAVYSLPYVVVMAVLGIDPGPKWYTKEMMTDPKVLEMSRKVRAEHVAMTYDPRKPYTSIEILTRDKKTFRKVNTKPMRGQPENPLDDSELREKFRKLASYAGLGMDKIDSVIKYVDELEELDDISKLCKILVV